MHRTISGLSLPQGSKDLSQWSCSSDMKTEIVLKNALAFLGVVFASEACSQKVTVFSSAAAAARTAETKVALARPSRDVRLALGVQRRSNHRTLSQ